MKPVKSYRKIKPLFFSKYGLVMARRDGVYLLQADDSLKLLFTFPNKLINRLLDRIKLMFRLRRSGVYSSIGVGDDFYFSHRRFLYHYNISKGRLNRSKRFERGRGPLQFTAIEKVPGFEDCVCYGEYFENAQLGMVHIYRCTDGGAWNVVHTFNVGSINHIHAIIPDQINQCVWILTGDFDGAACIWKATNDFQIFEEVVKGEQKYRACVAFPILGGLLYATDSQLERNSIRLLYRSSEGWLTKELFQINGSAIYGCQLKDYYVFSTSTEPGEEKSNWFLNLIDRKRGPGIVKNAADIILCDRKTFECTVLNSIEKDWYPYRLFQFGSIMFPNGKNESNRLYAYSVGNRKYDLSTMVFNVERSKSVDLQSSLHDLAT